MELPVNGPPGAGGRPARADAVAVLESNWHSAGYTSPNPGTYPWLWLWDSCFHAIVWAHLEDARATVELESSLRLQTPDGFVPHMDYGTEPEAARGLWGRAGASVITQPPMYGHALRELAVRGATVPEHLITAARRACAFLWHRRRAANGLLTIVHPWEGGNDDSPRWDGWCDGGYERGRWLDRKRELVRALHVTEDGAAVGSDAFTVQAAHFNALCAFNFAELAALTGDAELGQWAADLVDALDARWDPRLGTWTDAAPDAPASTTVRTLEALLGVLVTRLDEAREAVWPQLFDDDAFGARSGPCGVHRDEPAFAPTAYWRGPAWPQLTYLFWVAAVRQGRGPQARALARCAASGAAASGHAEYWQPDTGEPLGAAPQSWSTLWLVMEPDG